VLAAPALTLTVLCAALLGAPQSLASARHSGCRASASAHGGSRRSSTADAARACTHTDKGRGHHAAKPHRKHRRTKGKGHRRSSHQRSDLFTPALCADGTAPTSLGEGSFSCDDGSEPGCKDGATPVIAADGASLVCAVALEGELLGGECEEEAQGACEAEDDERECEAASASGGCEQEAEGEGEG